MAAPTKKPAPKSSAKPMGSTKRETPGKDKTKTARERSAERRSQQQIFRSLDKEDYATVKAFAEQKTKLEQLEKIVTNLEEKIDILEKKNKKENSLSPLPPDIEEFNSCQDNLLKNDFSFVDF